MSISRRHFLSGSAASFALLASEAMPAQQHGATDNSNSSSTAMEPWRPGLLDIHHISTGRGNSVLIVCPDGTSIMIDAGAVKGPVEAMGPARPDSSRRPGEWIGRYALHHLRTAPKRELDYFVLTHFHSDHMGDLMPDSPAARGGDYRLTGVSDVAELVPIRRLIDRGYPDYDFPAPATYDGTLNYIRFVRDIAKRGTTVERFKVGSRRQVALQHAPSEFPAFAIRNLAANGEVWTGSADDTEHMFPPLNTLKPDEFPPENACSIALRVDYGAFRYYIGGDLTCDTAFGTAPWLDVETRVAKSAGPVSVAALDHHGYFDATGPDFVRYMRSRIYIVQSWHASHPALSVLNRLYSSVLYPGDRDVLATGLVPAASLADARFSDRMLSQHGHVIVRVSPQGKQYDVIVLDDTKEEGSVRNRFGSYAS
jgi:beta-lactamase superfamily II metal-dependent hydrolase